MRNLNRLTHAANRLENGAPTIDRRKLPICEQPGCRRRIEILPDGEHMAVCYLHMTDLEKQHYYDAWKKAT